MNTTKGGAHPPWVDDAFSVTVEMLGESAGDVHAHSATDCIHG